MLLLLFVFLNRTFEIESKLDEIVSKYEEMEKNIQILRIYDQKIRNRVDFVENRKIGKKTEKRGINFRAVDADSTNNHYIAKNSFLKTSITVSPVQSHFIKEIKLLNFENMSCLPTKFSIKPISLYLSAKTFNTSIVFPYQLPIDSLIILFDEKGENRTHICFPHIQGFYLKGL